MRGINKAIIVGRLGQDPEIRYTANGAAVANLSVATSEAWKDKQTGEQQEKTEWHRIVIFGKLAEICQQYLKKGGAAYFEGRIQTRKWQDQQGNDRYSTEIVANVMQMLGDKQDADNRGDYGNRRDQPAAPAGNDPSVHGGAGVGTQDGDDLFDEIPF